MIQPQITQTTQTIMNLKNKLAAEFFGTFWLVFGGCGSAVLAAMFLAGDASPVNLGIGFVGVSLAFGLTVMTMAYAIGHISGCHLNPAVTIGLVVAGRHPKSEALPYIITQVIGGIAGATPFSPPPVRPPALSTALTSKANS
jgi:aquaporin Z